MLLGGVGGREGGIVVMWVHDQQVQCTFQVNISAAAAAAAEFELDGPFCLWVVVIPFLNCTVIAETFYSYFLGLRAHHSGHASIFFW